MTNVNPKYLIIGGSTKCATTSVFKYFEFHPQICKCQMKESRYFLEEKYQLVAKQRDKSAYKSFEELFNNCNDHQIRMEATPDYLYSSEAAKKIRNDLPDVKMVFILRDPVDRLGSWYRFSILNGLIEKYISFEEYIRLQQDSDNTTPQHLKSLQQGRYSEYLKIYYKIFKGHEIKICFYEDLVKNPRWFCSELSTFTNIDPLYFSDYNFVVHNRSLPVKSVKIHKLFRKLKRTVRPATSMLSSGIRKKLKLAGNNIETIYANVNTAKSEVAIEISTDLKKYLDEYYKNEKNAIYELSGQLPPWNTGILKSGINEI